MRLRLDLEHFVEPEYFKDSTNVRLGAFEHDPPAAGFDQIVDPQQRLCARRIYERQLAEIDRDHVISAIDLSCDGIQ